MHLNSAAWKGPRSEARVLAEAFEGVKDRVAQNCNLLYADPSSARTGGEGPVYFMGQCFADTAAVPEEGPEWVLHFICSNLIHVRPVLLTALVSSKPGSPTKPVISPLSLPALTPQTSPPLAIRGRNFSLLIYGHLSQATNHVSASWQGGCGSLIFEALV